MNRGQLTHNVVALFCGLLFSFGLGIAGMTQPEKVTGFLNILGAWDPTLLFVMGGAILFHAPISQMLRAKQRRNPQHAAAEACGFPSERPASTPPFRDPKLIGGAAVFGVGWGIAGFCPGPALVSLGGALPGAAVFTLGMILGMGLFHWLRAA